jgi:hypothetical protein
MTKAQQKTARWVVASLLLVAIVLGGAVFHTLTPVSGDAQPSGPDSAYVVLHIPNRSGSEVCGLNLNFAGLVTTASQALDRVTSFKRITPTDQPNRITLADGCVKPDEETILQFASGMGMDATLQSYSWIKTGNGMKDVLIPGTFEGVWKEVVTPRQPIPVLPPMQSDTVDRPLTTFSFELKAMPRGQLMVAQGMVLYEGQPLAVTDQAKQRELTQALNNMNNNPLNGLFKDRQALQQQLDELTIYSPFSGKVKSLTMETDGQVAKVTLELDPNDFNNETAPIN